MPPQVSNSKADLWGSTVKKQEINIIFDQAKCSQQNTTRNCYFFNKGVHEECVKIRSISGYQFALSKIHPEAT